MNVTIHNRTKMLAAITSLLLNNTEVTIELSSRKNNQENADNVFLNEQCNKYDLPEVNMTDFQKQFLSNFYENVITQNIEQQKDAKHEAPIIDDISNNNNIKNNALPFTTQINNNNKGSTSLFNSKHSSRNRNNNENNNNNNTNRSNNSINSNEKNPTGNHNNTTIVKTKTPSPILKNKKNGNNN